MRGREVWCCPGGDHPRRTGQNHLHGYGLESLRFGCKPPCSPIGDSVVAFFSKLLIDAQGCGDGGV